MTYSLRALARVPQWPPPVYHGLRMASARDDSSVRRFSRHARIPPEVPLVAPDRGVSSSASDAALIRACLKNDQDAFAVLVERYQKRAFWVAFHVLGRVEESRDVVQEAFVRVFRSLDKFDFGKSFYTWLYRIVMNLAIDALRKLQSARAVELEDGSDLPSDGDLRRSQNDEPGLPIEGDEQRRLVREAIAKLPPRFRSVIVLRDLEGLSCREIVPVLKVSHATVRWRLHRARQLFKEHWLRMTRRWN
jgi:RNA polymerase sigma-70 factor (ECF subfamily)